MEVVITIGFIILIVIWLARSSNGKKEKQPPVSPVTDDLKKQQANEIVTVILPTINHDK